MTGFTLGISPRGLNLDGLSPLRLPIPPLGHEGASIGGEGGGSIWSATFCHARASKYSVSRLSEIAISEELIARARGGEEAAQAAIYRGVGPAVFALTRRLVGNRAVAEDLFQDTMMVLFQRLGDFRGEAPLGIWLTANRGHPMSHVFALALASGTAAVGIRGR